MRTRRPPDRRAFRRRRLAAVLGLAIVVFGTLELAVGPASERIHYGADVIELEIRSAAVDRTLPINVVMPPDAERSDHRPVLVFLHGRQDDGEDSQMLSEVFAALADQGGRAPVLAFPNGGEASYWHDRKDGDWERYLLGEVVPEVVRRTGADSLRIAIGGISMGGFGALDVARLNPGRFCAVGAHSPAIWREAGETAPGAFDDEADFERHDLIEAVHSDPSPFMGQPVWVDSGEDDPFRPGIDAFAGALREAGAPLKLSFSPGGHDGDYWNSHWDEYMRFYADALARCER